MEVREVREVEMTDAAELVVAAYRALEDSPPVDDDGYGAELRAVARRARDAVVLVAVDAAVDAAIDAAGQGDGGGRGLARGNGRPSRSGSGSGGGVGGGGRAREMLVGCVTYVPDEHSPLGEDVRPGEASIRMLAVAPGVQRRGVGRALVKACIGRARAAGKDRLVLHSGAWMTAAHRLYDSLGFERLPERDWLPLPDVPLLAFALDLRDEVDR
jgi:ribosomal protein S18 acetylase RimI-like enzyme